MSFNSSQNASVVKTELDDVFEQTFSGRMHPGEVTAESEAVFHQDSADSSAVIMELFKGSGSWTERTEEENLSQGDPEIGNQKTFNVTNFARSIDVPKNFFDDNKHGSYEMMVKQFARRARTTRDKKAMGIYRNAASGTTTADGAALISDSHTALNGDTVDNKLTKSLTESSLNDAITRLYEMPSQDGEIDGFVPSTLLVPPKLFKKASEIVGSDLRSGTADNDINVIGSKYAIRVVSSPYLGKAAGGDDNNWFLLADEHSINRWVRQGVTTDLIDWRYQRNNNYIYKGEFREVTGAMSYEGIVGGIVA